MLLKNNKNKKSKQKVNFTKNPMLFTDAGELVGNYLNIVLDNSYQYLGDAKDVKKGIPNIGSMLKFLSSLIVVDLETREYMIIKVKDKDSLGVGGKFKVLNSMTELMNFKKFVNQNVAISVNMDALRKTASEQEEKEQD